MLRIDPERLSPRVADVFGVVKIHHLSASDWMIKMGTGLLSGPISVSLPGQSPHH